MLVNKEYLNSAEQHSPNLWETSSLDLPCNVKLHNSRKFPRESGVKKCFRRMSHDIVLSTAKRVGLRFNDVDVRFSELYSSYIQGQ